MKRQWLNRSMANRFLMGAALALVTLAATSAHAQLNGENLLGDTGVKSGTQPEPGFYAANVFYRYNTDTIKDPDGNRVFPDPTQAGSQTINAVVPLVIYVSPKKVLGANYGLMAVMPFANGTLEAFGLGLNEEVSTGPSDAYIVPLQLGWHFKRADAIAAFALFAPTGRHTAGASDNVGKGMWSYEVSGGTTVYLDEQKTLSVATTALWETHTKKQGTGDVAVGNIELTGVTVGQLLTVEGGVGKSFLHGAASIGMAYYAQWKLTSDEMGLPGVPALPAIDKHRVWGFGPDVTIPIAVKSRLISLVNVRYLWEVGARVKTQGESLLVTTTFPIPAVKISPTM